jgi:hypothetical protein
MARQTAWAGAAAKNPHFVVTGLIVPDIAGAEKNAQIANANNNLFIVCIPQVILYETFREQQDPQKPQTLT